MSYDLFFCVRRNQEPPSLEQFLAHFEGRSHYELNPQQAWYENESTGIYFSFEYDDTIGFTEDVFSGDFAYANCAFNLNYMRPHAFAFEAEPEVKAFVEAFNFGVEDPQTRIPQGQYTTEGFFQGWTEGNRFAYRAYGDQTDPRAAFARAASTAEIELAWRWNYNRTSLDNELYDSDVFTPTVVFFSVDSRARSAVVWGDGCAIAIPEVSHLLLGRSGLFNRRLWCLVPRDAASEVLAFGSRVEGDLPYYLLDYDHPPQEIEVFFRRQRFSSDMPERIPFDHVLNVELLEGSQT